MRLSPSFLYVLTLLAGSLSAQGFAHNRIEFSNWWLENREDRFPNFGSGNGSGDGLFKVLPAELLERDGNHLVSGYRIALSIDDGYAGSFPASIKIPGLQLHRTSARSIGGKTYETIDMATTVGPKFDPIPISLPKDDSWIVEVRFDAKARDPKLRRLLSVPALVNGRRAGLALLVLATPGDKQGAANPGVVLQSSYQERHVSPGRESYSGSYDASRAMISMFGQTGQPSASGELYAGLFFANPTLQIYGDCAGGVLKDPKMFETHLGPGAYATDMGSRRNPAFFGFYAQAEQFDPQGKAPTHSIFPFIVSTSSGGPTSILQLGAARMRVNLGELTVAAAFIEAGLFGKIDRYGAKGAVGFDEDQLGGYATPRITVPANVSLKGKVLWLQGLITKGLTPIDTTNVVRFSFN